MAITREKKQSVVGDLEELLNTAKLTAFASYDGLTVADLQELRRAARASNVIIKVVKNRLVRVAMSTNDKLKNADTSSLKGQLLYACSSEDEVAPAQVLAKFAKTHEALALKGGFDINGAVYDEAKIKEFASLPTKDQLRAQIAGTISAPLTSIAGVLSGNLRSVLYALNARIEQLEKA